MRKLYLKNSRLQFQILSDETDKEEVLYGEYHSGWFGSKLYCALGEEDDVYTTLHYEVIESRFSWVLDHQWQKDVNESVYEETDEQIWGNNRLKSVKRMVRICI